MGTAGLDLDGIDSDGTAPNSALSGRTNCASVARPAQAARVASAMSGRKRSSAASHTDALSTKMPAFQ